MPHLCTGYLCGVCMKVFPGVRPTSLTKETSAAEYEPREGGGKRDRDGDNTSIANQSNVSI